MLKNTREEEKEENCERKNLILTLIENFKDDSVKFKLSRFDERN
jgi:hypothetical protein